MKTPNFLEINNLHAKELFANFALNVADIEQFLMNSPLDVTKKPNVFMVERRMRLPLFATDFYHYIFKYGKIPTQLEFIDYYNQSNKAYLDKVINHNEEYVQGLYGRLCRTYPSLVRDVHLFFVLKESGRFKEVDYNLEVDMFGKADILVLLDDSWYGLKLRVKTRNSDMYAAKKDERGAVDLGYVPCELPIDLAKAKSLTTKGDSIKLYTLELVTEAIKES